MTQRIPLAGPACIVPFAVYLIGTAALPRLSPQWYALGYAVVTLAAALCVWQFWPAVDRLLGRRHGRIGWGVLTGLIGIVLWIGISHLNLERWLVDLLPGLEPSKRAGYEPFSRLDHPLPQAIFLMVRIAGMTLLVPIVEELFWRAFLLRWTIDNDWQAVPLGTFSWFSCLSVTALFALAHPEWLAAAVYSLLLNALLYWKRDLWLCVVAHATSNLVLAVYVLTLRQWWLW